MQEHSVTHVILCFWRYHSLPLWSTSTIFRKTSPNPAFWFYQLYITTLLEAYLGRSSNGAIIETSFLKGKLLCLAWLGVCCLPSAVEGRLANDASTFINRAVLHSVCHTALRSRFLPCPVICLCSSWCSTAMILVSHFSLVAYPCYPGLHLLPHYQIESADDSSW